MLGEQIGDESMVANRAIVAGDVNGCSSLFKIGDAGRKIGRANAVVERDAFGETGEGMPP